MSLRPATLQEVDVTVDLERYGLSARDQTALNHPLLAIPVHKSLEREISVIVDRVAAVLSDADPLFDRFTTHLSAEQIGDVFMRISALIVEKINLGLGDNEKKALLRYREAIFNALIRDFDYPGSLPALDDIDR